MAGDSARHLVAVCQAPTAFWVLAVWALGSKAHMALEFIPMRQADRSSGHLTLEDRLSGR
jgi:hypothetical protein